MDKSLLKYLVIVVVVCCIVAGLTVYVYLPQTPQPQTVKKATIQVEAKPIQQTIKTEVKNVVVYYREELLYSKDVFQEILKDKENFSLKLIKKLNSTVSGYGKKAVNFNVKLDPKNNLAILTCEVYGAVSKSGNKYYATFEWLIRPLGLDFIDNHFKETVKGLSWEGTIDNTPTKIVCIFPYTGLPYKAWTHPTGHCHAHVWWELKESKKT